MLIEEIIAERDVFDPERDRDRLIDHIKNKIAQSTDPAAIAQYKEILTKFARGTNPSRYLSEPLQPMPTSGRGIMDKQHNGRDIPVNVGTYVVAPEAGTITAVGNDDPDGKGIGRGGYVVLTTRTGEHRFFHLSETLVTAGKEVKRGQVVAKSGGQPGKSGAGYSTGPHLHWEYRIKGQVVDPLSYLR
jgi:murein DD-endopeptidase MepM/ murein hydrolase activator NlpD